MSIEKNIRLTSYYRIGEIIDLILYGKIHQEKSIISREDEYRWIILGQFLERACLLDGLEYLNNNSLDVEKAPEWGLPLDLRIHQDNITDWIKKNTIYDQYFNIKEGFEFCNINGEYYPKNLHKSYSTWASLVKKYNDTLKPPSPKKECDTILKQSDGYSTNAIEIMARIINWNTEGGRPSSSNQNDQGNEDQTYRELWQLSTWLNLYEVACLVMNEIPYIFNPYKLGHPSKEYSQYVEIKSHVESLLFLKETESKEMELIGRRPFSLERKSMIRNNIARLKSLGFSKPKIAYSLKCPSLTVIRYWEESTGEYFAHYPKWVRRISRDHINQGYTKGWLQQINLIPKEEMITFIKVDSLKTTLKDRVPDAFFFKKEHSIFDPFPDPCNKESKFYAPNLDAACKAWHNVKEKFICKEDSKTPRQEIKNYLKKNWKDLSPTTIKEISSIANWKHGGPTPTPQ